MLCMRLTETILLKLQASLGQVCLPIILHILWEGKEIKRFKQGEFLLISHSPQLKQWQCLLPYSQTLVFVQKKVFVITATGKPLISLFMLQVQTET